MKITFLGGGNMASALIGGMLKQGFAPQDIAVVELSEEGRARLASQFGVRTAGSLTDDVVDCDVLVLAVKPQQMQAALVPLAGRMSRQTVVSIAAGTLLASVSKWLGGHTRIVRAMPNTPALIGQGVTGLFADPSVSADERAAVERIIGAVGTSVWVDAESLIDVVTAVSGSGPAYVFYFIEALQAAGEAQGLPAETARTLALRTFTGASALAAQSTEPCSVLRERVTSKGGTTEAALRSMGQDGLPALIGRAVAAATERGRELGRQSQD
ncbi:pyrroline-5-carboxylate reductase [Uliginosibacterium sp. sgz301328]|uniref:pyrroline-5-carboxylate reductase n=1 Tax=Uliginosibacterium sp. sgz301328 TaxID=3243764 RepID=UPI00359DDFA6